MSKQITDQELTALLAEVETSIDGLLKSEKEKLAKAHPGEETSTETEPDESASAPPAGDDASASASASPPAPDAGAPADEASGDGAPPADDASASPTGDDGAPAGDPSAEGDPAADASTNPEELVPHYAKLPIEALKAHYLAAKMALAAMMGSAGGAPAGDASAAPPAPDVSAPPALKGEMKDNVEGNGENPLHASTAKSEKDSQIAELQKRLTDQEQSLAGLLTAVRTMVEAPVRKSVTSAADIEVAPTGEDVTRLDRKEIDRRLRRAAEGNLRKSDRDLINSFALGSVKVDAIAHLLK